MRWMLLLAVISGCAWTNKATVDAQKREQAEKANPALREQRLAREAAQSERDRAAVAGALGGLGESSPQESKKVEMDCRQDPSYPGMPGQIHCTER